ncbi:MAG: hypothetical protein E5V57_32010, partial [Mesorhizobium sp.]
GEISGKNFPAGSMGPKVSAAIEFTEATGKPAAIGRLDYAVEIVRGERGTWFEQALQSNRRASAG